MMPNICTCPMAVREHLTHGGAHSVGCPQWQPFAPHEPDTLRELTADDPRPPAAVDPQTGRRRRIVIDVETQERVVFPDADPVQQRECSEGASFEEHNAAMIELGRCPYCGLEDAR